MPLNKTPAPKAPPTWVFSSIPFLSVYGNKSCESTYLRKFRHPARAVLMNWLYKSVHLAGNRLQNRFKSLHGR
jgi:hypothetical protein